MEKIPDNSIDYAVMEKSKKIKMLPLHINWSDLGSFESIYKISTSDKNGNVSSKNNVFDNSKNNMVISGNKLITLIDINDLMVIDTPDATLICKKGSSQKIKKLLTQIETISPNITKKG
jgi:mannose-1-phosphate guanylyltransferase